MSGQAAWLARFGAFDAALGAGDALFHVGLAHGSMTLELYRPVGQDRQGVHSRDEIYIVRQGSARFRRDGETADVAAGDCLFVPAGMEHRFENLSADFDTWVVFWGPEGGED